MEVSEEIEDSDSSPATSHYQESLNPNNEVKVCAILTYDEEDATSAQLFKKSCDDLKDALRYGITTEPDSPDGITVVETQSVQREFFKLMLQWERRIIDGATASVMGVLMNLNIEEVNQIIRRIFAHLKSVNAYSLIEIKKARMILHKSLAEDLRQKEQQSIMRILGVVEDRWLRLSRINTDEDNGARYLSTVTTLWSEKFVELDTLGLEDEVCREMQELLKYEKEHLKGNDKLFADNYFQEWIYARGIPVAGVCELRAILPQLKQRLEKELEQILGVKAGPDTDRFLRVVITNLQRLDDCTFWLHFSGRHIFDGIQSSENKIPLLHHTFQAAGSLLSNVVVTIDCCYADAYVETYRFTVDANAEHSGFTVISSCCSNCDPPIHSTFTNLIAQALRGASTPCCAFVTGPCVDISGDRETRDCYACSKFVQKCNPNGTISIARIFSYIKDHISSEAQMPTIRRHYSNDPLPVSQLRTAVCKSPDGTPQSRAV